MIGHDGATTGQNAYLRIVPGQNTAVALLTNGGFPAELYYALFGKYSTNCWASVRRRASARSVRPTTSLDRYCGVFEKLSQRITVRADNDHLVASVEGQRYPAPTLTYRLGRPRQIRSSAHSPGRRHPWYSTT